MRSAAFAEVFLAFFIDSITHVECAGAFVSDKLQFVVSMDSTRLRLPRLIDKLKFVGLPIQSGVALVLARALQNCHHLNISRNAVSKRAFSSGVPTLTRK